jgi:hypothetical protein
MARSKLGQRIAGWSESATHEFRRDLDRLNKLPPDVVRPLVEKIVRTHPACNTAELAALEAEQRGITDSQELSDFIAAFVFLWENIDGDELEDVIDDLSNNAGLQKETLRVLRDFCLSGCFSNTQ